MSCHFCGPPGAEPLGMIHLFDETKAPGCEESVARLVYFIKEIRKTQVLHFVLSRSAHTEVIHGKAACWASFDASSHP